MLKSELSELYNCLVALMVDFNELPVVDVIEYKGGSAEISSKFHA